MENKQITNHAAAGKIIRAFLKKEGIPGRVRGCAFAGGNAVDVYLENQTPAIREKVEAFANQFQYGNFDGMIDLYEYTNRRDDIPQVKFVFVKNELLGDLKQKIWNYLLAAYVGMEDAPKDAKDADNFYNKRFDAYGYALIGRMFHGGYMDEGFWNQNV